MTQIPQAAHCGRRHDIMLSSGWSKAKASPSHIDEVILASHMSDGESFDEAPLSRQDASTSESSKEFTQSVAFRDTSWLPANI